MLKLGWFSTGRGPGSRNLLREVMEKKEAGLLNIELSFVFCNWDNTEEPNPRKEQRSQFFKMVKDYGIPLITISWKSFKPNLWNVNKDRWRAEYGKEIRKKIADKKFDVGILAGYMLWIDDITCKQYNFINLHPALPDGPKGTWSEVIWQLIREKKDKQGVMVHSVTSEWDRGVPFTYCEFPIVGGDYDILWKEIDDKLKTKSLDDIIKDEGHENALFCKIREEGSKRELPLIVETIKQLADGNIIIKNQKLYRGNACLNCPYDLSMKIDRTVGVD